MGLLAAALAMWAAIYLFAYEREYAGVPVEAGRAMVMEGSIEAVSGKSVLFRPDGSQWLYAVSSRDGACPLEAGERYRIKGEAYPLQAPCGPGIFDRERWGYARDCCIWRCPSSFFCRDGCIRPFPRRFAPHWHAGCTSAPGIFRHKGFR